MSEQYILEGTIKAIAVNVETRGKMLVMVSPTDGYNVSLAEKREWILLRRVKEGQSPTEEEAKCVKGSALFVCIGDVSFQELNLLKNNKQKVRLLLREISGEAKDLWTSAAGILFSSKENCLCYECNSIVVL